MPKRVWLMAFMMAGWLVVCPAWAQDGFYVISVSSAVGTKITTVPYTINQPGYYYFGGNLTYNATGTCLKIEADNVTLDLMGCGLTYGGAGGTSVGTGIYLHGRKNVEIRNGLISGFRIGIFEDSQDTGANHRIINIRANYNYNTVSGGSGIDLRGKNHLVRGCTASNNGSQGIYVVSGTIAGCVACDSASLRGIQLVGPGSLLDNIATNTNSTDTVGFIIGPTSGSENILMDGNSAGGNGINYDVRGTGTGIVWGVNAGR